jgi:serine/threonine protein phosphatase PrpC
VAQITKHRIPAAWCRKGNEMTTSTAVRRIEVAGLSDIGCKRKNNEDSFGYSEEEKIFLVCDGMGGMAAGEVASSVAVEHILRTYSELKYEQMTVQERLHKSILSANKAVWNLAQQDQRLHGMGTTLVAACVVDNTILFANVGDSRAYFLRNGHCVQVTEDHSCAAEYRKQGKADDLPQQLQQVITRAIGPEVVVEPDFCVAELDPGDRVLLATDGLTRYTNEAQLAQNLCEEEDLEAACHRLIALAHEKGAEDNVTCVLLRFH